MTCEGSPNAPGLIALSGTVLVVTWSAAIFEDSGMSTVATTTGPVVGTVAGPVDGVRTMSRMPTKATIARKTPTSRTSRFERFKLVLPEECVTGGTTLAPPKSGATIPKG